LRFDVFICHASEDKEAVAHPLARILRSRGFSVWIDEVELKLGDSLRQTIDAGLRTSTFGAVILSPSFFKKRWPQWELDGLADREMSSGTKVVLPIWHEVDHDDVAAPRPAHPGGGSSFAPQPTVRVGAHAVRGRPSPRDRRPGVKVP
jgi:hypothetical protein